MAGKYDLFEILYKEGGIRKVDYLLKYLRKSKSEYHTIYQTLLKLEKDGFIKRSKYGFQAIRSYKHNVLHQMIIYCMKNEINYNKLLNENIASFISKALLKRRFTIKDFKINPETFRKYVKILNKSGFLIILSRKPLEATIPYNSFLGDLLSFFKQRVYVRKNSEDFLEEIKKELPKFKKLSTNNPLKYKKILEEYEFKFIQHSLSLEGNPITISETILLLKDKIVPKKIKLETIQEVQNYKKAVELMLTSSIDNNPINKDTILNYHFLAMQHKSFAGKIRKIPVFIKNNPHFNVANVEEIETKLSKLLHKYYEFIGKKTNIENIIEFAAYFHNEFQFIHPFEDGNSRTTRILTFHILRNKNIPIMDIPLGLLEEYLFNTKGAEKRNDKKLSKVLQKIILYNLKNINEQIKD